MENFESNKNNEGADSAKQVEDTQSGDSFQKPAKSENVENEYPTSINLDKKQEEALRQEILKALEEN